ncbi:MAG: diguanylate cyclase [Sulfurimonadaceae bacterium]|nr:diguanylate cyclase [Sulfurimonadaceae bacterium]
MIRLLSLMTLAISLFASHPQFSEEERAYLKNKKEILMCIDPNWMPYEKIEDGKHIGMTRDYMELFSERIGVPITMVPTTNWMQSIEYAKARKCDIFSLAMSTPERETYMDFTAPYLSIPLVIATRIDELFIVDIIDVTDKQLGVVEGYAFAEILRDKYPNINLVDVPTVDDGLDMVAKGELFGFVGTLSSVGYAIQSNFIGELKVAGKFDDKWELGVGVRNDDPMLKDIFERAIDSLEYEKRQQILNHWISVKYDKGIDYDLIWKILGIMALFGLLFTYRHFELIKYNHMLEKLSITDKLTGLYNRIKTDSVLQMQIDMYARYKTPFSLLLIDLDHFKQVNDRYGHQVGDKVLHLLGEILHSEIRKTDIAGRWGGEEFMVILPATKLLGALDLAEKIRDTVQQRKYNRKHKVTVSIGVTEIDESDTFNTVIKRADDALYQAKENGRNRVEHFVAETEEVIHL